LLRELYQFSCFIFFVFREFFLLSHSS
jgi:hypothetical protein